MQVQRRVPLSWVQSKKEGRCWVVAVKENLWIDVLLANVTVAHYPPLVGKIDRFLATVLFATIFITGGVRDSFLILLISRVSDVDRRALIRVQPLRGELLLQCQNQHVHCYQLESVQKVKERQILAVTVLLRVTGKQTLVMGYLKKGKQINKCVLISKDTETLTKQSVRNQNKAPPMMASL